MGQPGFFDLSRRYDGLDSKKDPLVTLAAVIPWEMFRPQLLVALTAQNLRTRFTTCRTSRWNISCATGCPSCVF